MRKLTRGLPTVIICITLLLATVACRRDSLCLDHPHYPKISVAVDLGHCNGLTFDDLKSYMVVFYPIDDGIMELDKLKPIYHVMQSPEDFRISIAPADYKVVMYSNYSGRNIFYNTDDYDNIYVAAYTPASKTAAWHTRLTTASSYILEPDAIVTDHLDTFTVPELTAETPAPTLSLTPTLATQQVNITLRVRNLKYVRSFTGELGNVYSQYYLVSGVNTDSENAIQISSDYSSASFDQNKTDGTLTIPISTFGFKRNAEGDVEDAYLQMLFTLVDGSTLAYGPVDLTDLINSQPNTDANISLAIGFDADETNAVDIPPVISTGNDVDVDVGNWGDEVDVPLELE